MAFFKTKKKCQECRDSKTAILFCHGRFLGFKVSRPQPRTFGLSRAAENIIQLFSQAEPSAWPVNGPFCVKLVKWPTSGCKKCLHIWACICVQARDTMSTETALILAHLSAFKIKLVVANEWVPHYKYRGSFNIVEPSGNDLLICGNQHGQLP